MRIEPTERCSDGISRDHSVGRQTVFLAIGLHISFDLIDYLLRGRSKIRPTRTRSIITGTGIGRARMEIFRSGKSLGQQTGANPGLVIWRGYEAPVRLVRKQQL